MPGADLVQTNRESAIDTGTTLIGMPASDAEAIYAQIEGAEPMDGQYEGYWMFPCDTNVNLTMQYGDKAYNVSPADFNLGRFVRSSEKCTGAIFEMNLGSNSRISWIVGASFLKNVYSAFRFQPPAIGFAVLSGQVDTVSNGTTITPNTATGDEGTGGPGGSASPVGSAGKSSSVVLGSVALGAIGAAISAFL